MLGLPYVLHEWLVVEERLAVAIAFACVFVANFVIVRFYVFRSRTDWRKQFVRFALTSASTRAGEYLAFLAVHTWTDLHYIVIVLTVLTVSFTLKFVLYRTFVFGTTANGAN